MIYTCSKCKTEKFSSEFYIDRTAAKGFKSWCKACSRENSVNWGRQNKDRHTATTIAWRNENRERVQKTRNEYNRSPHGRWINAKKAAAQRGFPFELTEAVYSSFCNLPCAYCAGPTEPTGTGLDRLNSKLGYTEDNVVPCCEFCNHLKRDYTLEELENHIPKFMEGLRKVLSGK